MKPKITRYNASNARTSQEEATQVPSMAMLKRGVFRLNTRLLKLLAAEIGDGVEFLHDETMNEWYVAKAGNGLPIRKARHNGGTVHSAVVRRAIEKHTEVEHGRFLVASEPTDIGGTKCYAILTGSAKMKAA